MMSFLTFHKNSRVDHFVVYDFGIPDQFYIALKTLSQIHNLNFTYLLELSIRFINIDFSTQSNEYIHLF